MDEYQGLLQEAKSLLVQRRFDLAVDAAGRAVQSDPKRSTAYLIRAEALRKLNQPDRAMADLAVAIRIEPGRASSFVIRAEILKKRCSFDQAIADATQAIFLEPDNAAAFAIRAECRLAIGDKDGAAFDAGELFRIDPTRPPSIPTRTPSPEADRPVDPDRDAKRAEAPTRPRDDSVFADEKAVDRSLTARKLLSAEAAAEILADSTNYRPETVAPPLPRTKPVRPRSKPERRSSPLVPAIALIAVLGLGVYLGLRSRPAEAPPRPAPLVVASKPGPEVAPPGPGGRPGLSTASARPPGGDRTQPGPIGTPPPPLNATVFRGHSYQFYPDVVTWLRAKNRCEEMGGHLATIASLEEDQFVRDLARRGIERPSPRDGVWLGGTDEAKEGDWRWLDGSGFLFSRWTPGQPNNKNGAEHYALLTLDGAGWADQPNASTQHVTFFVCEWDRAPELESDGAQLTTASPLEGHWEKVAEVFNGKTDTVTERRQVSITGAKFWMSRVRSGKDDIYTGTIRVDPSKSTFDIHGINPAGLPVEFRGIYELDGDTLRLCYVYYSGPTVQRPTKIRSYSVPQTTMVSLVLKRSGGR